MIEKIKVWVDVDRFGDGIIQKRRDNERRIVIPNDREGFNYIYYEFNPRPTQQIEPPIPSPETVETNL